MLWEIPGFLLSCLFAVAFGGALAGSRFNPLPAGLVFGAVVLRIVGAVTRYDVMKALYGSVNDPSRYYNRGRELVAERLWAGNFAPLTFGFWFDHGERWWGTAFMDRLAGVVVALTGPTLRGVFVVFAVLSFVGLYLIVLTVYRRSPGRSGSRFALVTFVLPSLWFWPSCVGKEAVMVFCVGLVFWGLFAGRRIRWVAVAAGLALALAIRPHVAVALGVALAGSFWLSSRRGRRVGIFSLLAVAGLVAFLTRNMIHQFGIEADLEGVAEFVEHNRIKSSQGGSEIQVGGGLAGIPLAFVNIWMRPFPWEAAGFSLALSAAEIAVLWVLAFRARRRTLLSLKGWRVEPLVGFTVLYFSLYTLMVGLTFGNLGIIARQRSAVLPFALLLATGAAAPLSRHEDFSGAASSSRGRRRRVVGSGGARAVRPKTTGGRQESRSSSDVPEGGTQTDVREGRFTRVRRRQDPLPGITA